MTKKRGPVCPCCQGKAGPFKADGRVKRTRVKRKGGMVTRTAAWVQCRRHWGGSPCGWGWWSTHPALVFLGKQHRAFQLVRPYQKPPGYVYNGGRPTGSTRVH